MRFQDSSSPTKSNNIGFGRLCSVYAEGDDDEYIDESDLSDELFRSVDAFSSDENEEWLDF